MKNFNTEKNLFGIGTTLLVRERKTSRLHAFVVGVGNKGLSCLLESIWENMDKDCEGKPFT